jgi:starch synthase
MMISSEATPWAKSGGLADVVGALPEALATLGHPVSIVIPRYQKAVSAASHRVADRIPVALGGAVHFVDVWQLLPEASPAGVSVYFVDEPGLFEREGLYGNAQGDYLDNHVRFAILCKGALEVARRFFPTDVFHCHDWQTGLLPLYLKETLAVDPAFLGATTLMTIHNLAYRGIFNRSQMGDISLPQRLFRPDLVEFYGDISLLKAGLVYADALSTVSPKYASEIQTPDQGEGLEGLLRARRASLSGILNGVDYTAWNPETDRFIPAHYSAEDLSGKKECKRQLIRETGLQERAMERPLMGIVSRFADQKGFDIVREMAWPLFGNSDAYLVVLGNGERRYEEMFSYLERDFPGRVALKIGFNEGLAHRIEAGSDMFLMPSRYEPCGLNQMYSLRYGTVPVVRATGGLDDTVEAEGPARTGFKFTDYNENALLETVHAALVAWEDTADWEAMMVRGMKKNFSWPASAAEYSRLYGALQLSTVSRL